MEYSSPLGPRDGEGLNVAMPRGSTEPSRGRPVGFSALPNAVSTDKAELAFVLVAAHSHTNAITMRTVFRGCIWCPVP